MPLQSITYLISPQGKVTIEVQGAQGKSCMDISRRVMEALGESESTELKPEYYQGTNDEYLQNFSGGNK